MSFPSQKLMTRGAVCGFALLALSTNVSAAAISYTDFGAFQAAALALTTESFDASPWLPIGTKPPGISHLGVSWTAANEIFAFSGISRSGPNAITANDGVVGDSGPSADIFDWIEAVLPSNTTAVGGWITSFNQVHGIDLRAYDILDNLLGSVSLGITGNPYVFLGLVTDTAIAKVRFASMNVTNRIGDDIALDDFAFGGGNIPDPEPVPVPEPAGLVLFGAALAVFAFARRRKESGWQVAPAAPDSRTLADLGMGPREALAVAQGIGIHQLRQS